jgi:hypothetical protein
LSGGEKIEMMDGKYSEKEINNINEIEQQLNRDCQYITIAIGNSRILQFIRQRKIEEVEKTYNGQAINTDDLEDEISSSKKRTKKTEESDY